MKILGLFGLARKGELDLQCELNANLRRDLSNTSSREVELIRENERLRLENEQLLSKHEQTKRGAKVLAAAVQTVHRLNPLPKPTLNGLRK